MLKKVSPETSPTDCSWNIQPNIYDENGWPRDFSYSLYMAYTLCTYDEKRWSSGFPYSLFMACRGYIYDEERWSRDFPLTACSWPIQPI
jgi:hypothetical protein